MNKIVRRWQRFNGERAEVAVAPFSRGFTLLELLVVVAIIGLLAAYVGPRYFSQIGKSEQNVARSQIEALARALVTYRLDTGQFPGTEDGLAALMVKPTSAPDSWNGPYLEKTVPADPWGRAYIYQLGADGYDFEIVSLGKDGIKGGTGASADIQRR